MRFAVPSAHDGDANHITAANIVISQVGNGEGQEKGTTRHEACAPRVIAGRS
jgi:hypothetical protein